MTTTVRYIIEDPIILQPFCGDDYREVVRLWIFHSGRTGLVWSNLHKQDFGFVKGYCKQYAPEVKILALISVDVPGERSVPQSFHCASCMKELEGIEEPGFYSGPMLWTDPNKFLVAEEHDQEKQIREDDFRPNGIKDISQHTKCCGSQFLVSIVRERVDLPEFEEDNRNDGGDEPSLDDIPF